MIFPAVKAINLIKNFGEFRAVDDVSFEILQGETFAVLGENGAGKSTTMRMLACRSPLSSGELFVDNLDVKICGEKIRSIIGVVPQENNLDPDLNVLENLLVYSRYFRIPKDAALRRSLELLDFVKLGQKTNAKVDALSGGMKRRLIIARALLHRPKILLLDEPTTGLDPNVRLEIWDKLEELRRRDKITIILSTHYMDEAEKLSQKLIVLAHGRVIIKGNPQEIIEKSVKNFALEIRETDSELLKTDQNHIFSQKRNNSHIYFAETSEHLTSLMRYYPNKKMFLRPSNLEDVFLKEVTK